MRGLQRAQPPPAARSSLSGNSSLPPTESLMEIPCCSPPTRFVSGREKLAAAVCQFSARAQMCIFIRVHCSVPIYIQVLQAAPSSRVPAWTEKIEIPTYDKGGKSLPRRRLLPLFRKLNTNSPPPSEESDGSVNCMQLWGLIAGLVRGGEGMMSPSPGEPFACGFLCAALGI